MSADGPSSVKLLVLAGFRCHVLLPHELVGTIIDGQPTFKGLTEAGGTFFRGSREILDVHRTGTTTTVTALAEIWIQEPGLSVKIQGGGEWRGFGRNNAWTSPWYTVRQRDAHKSTVHFPRVRTNPNYTIGVEYREGSSRWRFRSDGGFTKLLNQPQPHPDVIPWQDAEVFGRGYPLDGIAPATDEVLRRWELAGHPDSTWLNLLGWTGGAAAVTDIHGRDVGAPGDRYLWQARSWRRMRPGDRISQTLTMRRIA